jgi:hypothetical protein
VYEKKVSYIWESKKKDFLNWTISTWSKHISNSYVYRLGNPNDKQYLPADYVYVPRKKNVAETVPGDGENNNKRRQNNNNNNQKSRKKKATTKQINTGRTRSVADMFAASFAPDPAFIEQAKAMANQDDVINVEDDDDVIDIEESGDQSNPNSTDPSLIVHLPGNVNDGSIPNASRTTAADFEATVTTILEAARINGTEEKTG